MKKRLGLASMIGMAVVVAACGKTDGAEIGTGTPSTEVEKPKEPYTMVIHGGGFKLEEFDSRFRDVLQAKFPHITFEYIQGGAGATIQDLAAAGRLPDIIRNDPPVMRNNYFNMKLEYDLREQIEKNKYDLKRFNQAFINEIIDLGGKTGAIYGLPTAPYMPTVLYYNKDLFDKFGVGYPTDGMSWDQVYELAQKMSRVDGGQVYRGFSASMPTVTRDNVFNLPIVDPEKDGLGNIELWTRLFNNMKRFYEIPNNPIESTGILEQNAFMKGNVALHNHQLNVNFLNFPEHINWDIVSVPYLEGAPKLMPIRGPSYFSITQQSKHKEEAFLVIAEMLSDEVQMRDSRNGMPTTLSNPAIQAALGADYEQLKGKNIKAVTYYEAAPIPPRRAIGKTDISESSQAVIMSEQMQKVARNQADVNTSLREADERIRKMIEAERNK